MSGDFETAVEEGGNLLRIGAEYLKGLTNGREYHQAGPRGSSDWKKEMPEETSGSQQLDLGTVLRGKRETEGPRQLRRDVL